MQASIARMRIVVKQELRNINWKKKTSFANSGRDLELSMI